MIKKVFDDVAVFYTDTNRKDIGFGLISNVLGADHSILSHCTNEMQVFNLNKDVSSGLIARRNISQFSSLKIRQSEFLNCIKSVNPRLFRLWSCEMFGPACRTRQKYLQSNPKKFMRTRNVNLKRLNTKELPSRPVGLSFHGLDALCLSLLKTAGTTAEKNGKNKNDKHS